MILPVKDYGDSLLLSISYVGKKSAARWIDSRKKNENLSFVLKDNSLTLEEINVNQEFRQNKNSVSSIVFNEEAIERVQAFSLMDVLNTLPGKQNDSTKYQCSPNVEP